MFKRLGVLLGLVVLVGAMLTLTSSLNLGQEVPVGQEYIVPAQTMLTDVAENFFGTPDYWPAIMAATNRKSITDPSFIRIEDPKKPIEAGSKLWIPSKDWADAFMAVWTPNKPELLFGTRAGGQLVVASWWTAGGEAEGLAALFDIYRSLHPDVEIVNAAIAGGAGFNFRAALKPRLIAGDPPDTFQLHAGMEVETYDPEVYLHPLDDLYIIEGWDKVFPPGLLKALLYKGHYWGVPVNIHRANILWYDKKIFAQYNLTPPTSWQEFFQVGDVLKAQGIIPLAQANAGGWEATHTFETVLLSVLGPEKYKGLWTGKTPWTDPGVTQALETFKRILDYVNSDYPALTWDEAAGYLVAGKAAMYIHGDWTNGYFMAKGYENYGWKAVPGSEGVFDFLSDTFALPERARNFDNAVYWLSVCGSKEGQIAFNTRKGSIPARGDLTAEEKAQFNPYLQWNMEEWSKDAIVPSLVHGAAAIESWVSDIRDAINLFLARKDVEATQAALVEAAQAALGS